MRLLLDICISSRRLREVLTQRGCDVVLAASIDPKASDETLLAIAFAEDRVLVTADKDFGELVFARKLPHRAIIRIVEMSVDAQVTAVEELLDQHVAELAESTIITVTHGRIRMRRDDRSSSS